MKYVAVVEKTDRNYSAYLPDLPGCVATGRTLAAVRKALHEALLLHLEGLREDGTEVPDPSARVEMIET